jgi:hypothetical protein
MLGEAFGNTSASLTLFQQIMEVSMHIKARKSDWHPDNSRIRPSVWTVPIILTVIVAVAVIVAVGAHVNGNGMPFLS